MLYTQWLVNVFEQTSTQLLLLLKLILPSITVLHIISQYLSHYYIILQYRTALSMPIIHALEVLRRHELHDPAFDVTSY